MPSRHLSIYITNPNKNENISVLEVYDSLSPLKKKDKKLRKRLRNIPPPQRKYSAFMVANM